MAWTDERLDDLAARMDAGFTRVDDEIRELRRDLHREINTLRTDLQAEIRGARDEQKGDAVNLRQEMASLRDELKGDIAELRTLTVRFGIAFVICLLGAVLAGPVATSL